MMINWRNMGRYIPGHIFAIEAEFCYLCIPLKKVRQIKSMFYDEKHLIAMDSIEIKNRFEGCLYGQAMGDALGLGTEGLYRDGVMGYCPNGLTRYDQIVPDSHCRRWPKGDWTDNTDMMV